MEFSARPQASTPKRGDARSLRRMERVSRGGRRTARERASSSSRSPRAPLEIDVPLISISREGSVPIWATPATASRALLAEEHVRYSRGCRRAAAARRAAGTLDEAARGVQAHRLELDDRGRSYRKERRRCCRRTTPRQETTARSPSPTRKGDPPQRGGTMTMETVAGLRTSVRPLARENLEAVVAIDAAIEGRPRGDYFERRLKAALLEPKLHAQFAATDDAGLAGYILAGDGRRVRTRRAGMRWKSSGARRRPGPRRRQAAVRRARGWRAATHPRLRTQATWNDTVWCAGSSDGLHAGANLSSTRGAWRRVHARARRSGRAARRRGHRVEIDYGGRPATTSRLARDNATCAGWGARTSPDRAHDRGHHGRDRRNT